LSRLNFTQKHLFHNDLSTEIASKNQILPQKYPTYNTSTMNCTHARFATICPRGRSLPDKKIAPRQIILQKKCLSKRYALLDVISVSRIVGQTKEYSE